MGISLSTRNLRYHLHRVMGRKTTRLDGMTLSIGDGVSDALAREIVRGGYEKAERELARKAIRPGDNVLEIGAGMGIVGLMCAQLAGPGRVTSYEANATLEPLIRHNFALNGLSPDLVLKAVTVDGGPISFYRNDNVVSSSLYDRKMDAQKIEVASDPIDAALRARRADVVVMDVEGAEIDLLPAADLTGVREIIVEVHPHIVGEDRIQAMLAALAAKGFARRVRQHKTEWLSRRS